MSRFLENEPKPWQNKVTCGMGVGGWGGGLLTLRLRIEIASINGVNAGGGVFFKGLETHVCAGLIRADLFIVCGGCFIFCLVFFSHIVLCGSSLNHVVVTSRQNCSPLNDLCVYVCMWRVTER